MKFKVGDKVRILPSATSIMVAKDEVGKTWVIVSCDSSISMRVYMDKPRNTSGCRMKWYVETFCIEHINMAGQLLFDFMKEGSK